MVKSRSQLNDKLTIVPTDLSKVSFGVDDLNDVKSKDMRLDLIENIIYPKIDNIAALSTLGSFYKNNDVVPIKDHTANDNGGGDFKLDTSGALGAGADNGGTIIATNGPTDSYFIRAVPNKIITPQMFGAKGDASSDSGDMTAELAAIDKMIAAAVVLRDAGHKPQIFFPPTIGYRVNGTVSVPWGIVPVMKAFLIAEVAETAIAMDVGTVNIGNSEIDGAEFLIQRHAIADWSIGGAATEGSIGLRLINAESSEIFITIGGLAGFGFKIGVQLLGWATGAGSKGCAYNVIDVGRVFNCQYGFDFTSISEGAGLGFANENKLRGGRFGMFVDTHVGTPRWAMRFTSQDFKNKSVNGNVWHDPNIELREDGEGVLIEYGNENFILNARFEGNSPVFARVEIDKDRTETEFHNINNTFTFRLHSGILIDESKRASSVFGTSDEIRSLQPINIFDSGPMHKVAVMYDETEVHIPNVHIVHATTGASTVSSANTTFFISEAGATIDDGNDEIDDVAHTVQNEDVIFWTGGSLPSSPNHPNVDQEYYAINIQNDTFQLSETKNGSAATLSAGSGTYNKRHNYVELASAGARGVGIYVNTKECKRFLITKDVEDSNSGRIRVQCFDANGIIIPNLREFTVTANKLVQADHIVVDGGPLTFTNSGGALPSELNETDVFWARDIEATQYRVATTKGGSALTLTGGSGTHTYHHEHHFCKGSTNFFADTSFGGTYSSGSDFNGDHNLHVRDEVKYINCIITAGSIPIRIRSFKIYALDKNTNPSTWVNYKVPEPGIPVAIQVPATGVYLAPFTVLDHTPNNARKGWIQDISGSPGTWLDSTDIISTELGMSSDVEGGVARLTLKTTHETHTLINAPTSDTTTISIPTGARLLGVSFCVNTAVVDSAGDNSWSADFVGGFALSLVSAASEVLNTKIDKMITGGISTGVVEIRFTANGGNFTAGVIEIVAYYEILTSLADV